MAPTKRKSREDWRRCNLFLSIFDPKGLIFFFWSHWLLYAEVTFFCQDLRFVRCYEQKKIATIINMLRSVAKGLLPNLLDSTMPYTFILFLLLLARCQISFVPCFDVENACVATLPAVVRGGGSIKNSSRKFLAESSLIFFCSNIIVVCWEEGWG